MENGSSTVLPMALGFGLLVRNGVRGLLRMRVSCHEHVMSQQEHQSDQGECRNG